MRSVSTFLILAFLATVFVTIPACHPVREITGYPSASIAMAQRATDICSPVDSSISISRLEARGLISFAFSISSSVVSPWADNTATT